MAEPSRQVGVVAIGRNEGERLKRCLASIPRDLPTVYVDSASSDGSVAAAQAAGAEVVELDMAIPFTAARARNEGWRTLLDANPDLEFVQFVDGDCEFEAGWIDTAFAFLKANPKVAVACGRRRERFPDATFYNRVCDDEWNTPVGEAAACGGDALVRVEALLQVAGYDGGLMAGEEPEMCGRMREAGWRIHRLDAAMTIHDAAMHRFGQWWQRARRSGYGYAQVWNATRQRENPLYARELRSALIWAGAVPLVALLLWAVFDWRFALIALLAWPLQLVRVARREGWTMSALLLVAKSAEIAGALAFFATRLGGRARHSINYK